jgi:tRNA-dihydrouridine synthase B
MPDNKADINNRFEIGGVSLKGPFLLAPLAGITDAVMRELCEGFGAALTYTEMVSAKGLYYNDRNTEKLLYISPDAGPTAIQLFGSEPDIIAYAVEKLEPRPNAIIDINMGCPVPKVVKNGDGSALMRDPELAYKVVKAACGSTDKPVTVKMRKGFDEGSINAPVVAKACEEGGASAVCVHGRTREQYYKGEADWDIIREVKKAVNIPVIGNGDVKCGQDGPRMLEYTGCDMVMIARGALGNPWIFEDLARAYRGEEPRPERTEKEKREMMLRHLDGLIVLKGEYSAVREMRKHVGWYTKGMRGAAALRSTVNNITDVNELRKVLSLEA